MTPKEGLLSVATVPGPQLCPPSTATNSVGITLTQFDRRYYVKLIEARGETISKVVTELKPLLRLCTAIDAGCGIGYFTETLRKCGLSVGGFDGRMENVTEARNRFPKIPFEQGDIEDPRIVQLGKFDLVLCFGLLYHLENPLLAIRHLRALTGKGLLLESMCVPGADSGMVLREEPAEQDQSLTDIALYPSEGCLVKMLYRAGFAVVHRVGALPDHDDFRETPEHARRRTVLFASDAPLAIGGFERVAEPREERDPWARSAALGAGGVARHTLVYRVRRFVAKPRRAQYISVAQRTRGVLPGMPIPLRLKFGAWWIAEQSALDYELMYGRFEGAEMSFVQRLLRPGMTVLDVGAHHGLYTLLMSKGVGAHGTVIAFEPSPRECKRLARHLRVNRCRNAVLKQLALGDAATEEDLFLVEGQQDWCNSLRPPAVEERTSKVRVQVWRVDDVLEKMGISRVDFIKLDVEGAELSFLSGARRLLNGIARPAILAEVQDVRTRPWGYAAREIIQFLMAEGYGWYALGPESKLLRVSTDLALYDANLVALPEERAQEFHKLLESSCR